MGEFDQMSKDDVFNILFREAFGSQSKRSDIFSGPCEDSLNVSYRRFMILSCIDKFLSNIKYEKQWDKLRELSAKALHADSCDVLFPILKETTHLILSVYDRKAE
ncbi:hypothetical protein LJC68_08385 [Bacteroidales bacterium OttesenSCG-928-B11]|nr:hypothetical protein [Bacteroidales bacterium OttesenSCG-928-E04]MDL2308244.1 hypothetical protein [Bacteroidales bacterium OttesenSCG-928-C03]MDL2312878.1 hypothetical protein [Bacteroidales bacterium OttesenSCG-928-B11]MDL2326216.1 hypothetical protein [Bacteroidales bacterium OttesenSCG-928-A14]